MNGSATPAFKPYDLVIFDFDGTLADSLDWLRSEFDYMVARFGLPPLDVHEREALRAMSGRQIMDQLDVSRWRLPSMVRHMRRRKLDASDRITLFEGIPELLDRLRANGITVAVVSSDSEESVRRVLGACATRIACFDCGAALFGKRKKFRRVAKRLDVAPARTLCIGDEQRDIEAAKAAGMKSAAVSWGYALPEALAATDPTHMFASIGEMTGSLLAA